MVGENKKRLARPAEGRGKRDTTGERSTAQKRTRKRESVRADKTSATHCPLARVRALARQTLSRALYLLGRPEERGAKSIYRHVQCAFSGRSE